jgi:L-threonylcarbamoyladenylate synthase
MDFNAITNSIIFSKEKDKISVVSFHEIPDEFKNNKKITAWVVMSSNAKNYARLLYGTLRDLDSLNSDIILVEQPPQNSGWIAINDRLNRASKEKE